MSLTREEQGVLLTLHEYSPLWEIASELGDILATDPTTVRSKATDILRDFARRGWLQLHRERIVSDDVEGQPAPVAIARLEEILGDQRNWLVPRDRDEPEFDLYIFDTTPSAEEVIRAGALDDVWPGGIQREEST